MRRLLPGLVALCACASRVAPEPPSSARTTQSKVVAAASPDNVFEAARYGAVADDERDDTEAIQAAIDRARLVAGGIVRLPAGTLRVSDRPPLDQVALSLDGASGLSLQGMGADRTKLVLVSEGDAHVIELADSTGVTIEKLSIDGRRAQHSVGHGIRAAQADGLTLRDLDLRALSHYGIGLQRGAFTNIVIERVAIDDTGGDGIDFKNERNANRGLLLRQLRISRPGQVAERQAGLDLRGPATVQDVTVSAVPKGGTGIRFREDGPETGRGGHDSTLTRFEVHGETGSTGVAVACDRVQVSSGAIYGGEIGVVVLGTDARVSDVRVRGAVAGVRLEGEGTLVERSSFIGCTKCGICVGSRSRGTRILPNSFADNASDIDDRGVATEVTSP